MKNNLYPIYKTTDPEKETWWTRFNQLEELRNLTIHTKQHLSEQRYGKLLEMEIFETIIVYKSVINFYGQFIRLNSPDIMSEMPYGFGFDESRSDVNGRPKLSEDLVNNLHNPSNPL